jgi:hypothetical protein
MVRPKPAGFLWMVNPRRRMVAVRRGTGRVGIQPTELAVQHRWATRDQVYR